MDKTLQALLEKAAELLERGFDESIEPGLRKEVREFYELRLQAAIFNYDVVRAIATFFSIRAEGFAQKVVLRDIVHKLYEYDQCLSKSFLQRLLGLARDRGLQIDPEAIRAEQRTLRSEFKVLRRCAALRNEASGHYGKDTARQAKLIASLDRDEVINVAKACLQFSVAVNKTLAKVGRNGA
jgi:hypothetical protein